MTTVIFWVAFIGLFFAGLNALPDVAPLSEEFNSALTLIVSNMKAWNALFPITELFICVGILATFYIVKFGWRATKWVIHIVRGSGASA